MSSVPRSRFFWLRIGQWSALADDLLVLGRLLRRASPLVLTIPAVTAGLVLLLAYSPWYSLATKDFQEIVAPSILGLATAASLALAIGYRQPFLTWQLLLVGALFCRELHFVGTNNGIYVALVILLWYLARRVKPMRPLSESPAVLSLLVGALWAYLIAKTFDRGYWRALFPVVEPFRDSLEESLESTGHLLIGAMVLVSGFAAAALARPNGTPEKREKRYFVRWALMTLLPLAAVILVVALRTDARRPKPTRAPGELPFELSSLAVVDRSLGENLFLAGSDEHRDISIWTIDEADEPVWLADLELKIPHPDGDYYQLDDLEGLASAAGNTYFAVTSHRQLSREKERERMRSSAGTECALISFQLQRTGDPVHIVNARTVCRDLLARIRALGVFESVNWQYAKSFRWRRLATSWQIDLEGLAYVDRRILLGFKNPVEDGRATIVAFDPAADCLSLSGRYDFHGQGILALEYDKQRDRLLALTNDPLKSGYGDCCLWVATRDGIGGEWRFSAKPTAVLEKAEANLQRKASGVALGRDRMFVCFDDPQRPVIHSFALP